MQFLPSNMQPEFISIDATKDYTFTWQANGDTQYAYQLYIYKNSDNSLVYDSTKIISSTESHTLPAGTLTNGVEYKWKLHIYKDDINYIESEYILFKTNSAPQVTLTVSSTINYQNYEFIATYTHPENVAPQKFKFILYNSNDEIIIDTDYIYLYNIKYKFTGLQNNTTYKVECIVVDQNNLSSTSGKQTFSVSYTVPDSIPDLNITPDNANGIINISWSDIIQLSGVSVGNYSFTTGKFGQGIYVEDNKSYIKFDYSEPSAFNLTFRVKLPNNFKGDFCVLGNDEFKIGYDGIRFYYECLGFKAGSNPVSLPTDFFLVGVKHLKVIIKTNNYTEIIG